MKRIQATQLEEEAQYLRLLVFGEPGMGKTWLGASAALDPISAPCLFIEYRSQVASLRSNPAFAEALDDGRLVILQLSEYKELNRLYSWLFQGYGSNKNFDDLFPEAPKTVIIDSLTELQRAEVMRIAGNVPNKFLRDVEAPEIKHWGSILNEFTLLANLFYKLPYHVIFAGLEEVDYGSRKVGESPPISGYRLAMQGSSKRQFPAYALTVMRLERAPRNSPAFNVGHTQSIKAKTKEQTGMFPTKIVGPTIPGMVKMLRGEQGGQ